MPKDQTPHNSNSAPANQTPSSIPANEENLILVPIRRVPSAPAFLFTGGLIGLIVGMAIGYFGSHGTYSALSATFFIGGIFALLGVLGGGIVFIIFDRPHAKADRAAAQYRKDSSAQDTPNN